MVSSRHTMMEWFHKHLVRRKSKSSGKTNGSYTRLTDDIDIDTNCRGTDLTDNIDSNDNIDNNGSGTSLKDLTDDIVVNILSRLPVRCIMNLQTVCKKWLALTSSSYFAETHFKSRAESQISKDNVLDLFLFDEEAERYKLVKIMSNGFIKLVANISPKLVGSYNGLLVFKMFHGWRFLTWDLVTREYAYINPPTNVIPSPLPFHELWLSAILSHSSIQGYKLLFSKNTSNSADQYEFFIYESRNKTWRKLPTSSYPPSYPPSHSTYYAIVNPTIYKSSMFWMGPSSRAEGVVHDLPPCRSSVVKFNMVVEDFRIMPHPGDKCKPLESNHHCHMYLFEDKGQLYFVRNCLEELKLWSLEGYDNWFWLQRNSIKLDYVLKEISSTSKNRDLQFAKFLKIEGDALYFHCFYRGLFMFDWRKKTVKKLDILLGTIEQQGLYTYSDTSLSLESGGLRPKTSRRLIHRTIV